eukprot:273636-Chlamydomonas_euryale.AAC.9
MQTTSRHTLHTSTRRDRGRRHSAAPPPLRTTKPNSNAAAPPRRPAGRERRDGGGRGAEAESEGLCGPPRFLRGVTATPFNGGSKCGGRAVMWQCDREGTLEKEGAREALWAGSASQARNPNPPGRLARRRGRPETADPGRGISRICRARGREGGGAAAARQVRRAGPGLARDTAGGVGPARLPPLAAPACPPPRRGQLGKPTQPTAHCAPRLPRAARHTRQAA